jgi:hypothetical protein
MKNLRSYFNEAFESMPYEFTSNEFAAKARDLGVDRKFTASGRCGEFLKLKAVQIHGKRLWRKRNRTIATISNEAHITPGMNTVETMIYELKKLGYKILKPTTNYEEILTTNTSSPAMQ